MTEEEIDKLWSHNVNVITRMDNTSGAVVRAALRCMERNGGTYIRLTHRNDHEAGYEFIEGDSGVVDGCAKAAGAKITDTTIGAHTRQ